MKKKSADIRDVKADTKDVKKEEKKHSLQLQFTLFFILFIIAIYSVVISTSLQQLVGITEAIGAQLGNPIVETVAGFLDGDAFESLSKSLDPQDPYYEQTRLKMLAVKEESNCLYLYTMAPVEDRVFRYIIDGSATPDDSEHFSPLGAEEDISSYYKAVSQTMEKKTELISRLDLNRQWGLVVSTYGSILNSRGEAVGIIGCDFKAEDIYYRLWSRILNLLIVSGIFVVVGLATYLVMVHAVNKQNQRLLELKEAAEASSLALKEERDTIAAMKDALKVGLFFMDKHFIIQDQYSRFLEEVLEVKDLAGKKFTDLISASIQPKEITSLMEYFVLLFNRSQLYSRNINPKMLENMNPIQEMTYISPESGNKKNLQCTFVAVDRGGGKLFILGNIHDITREKDLARRLADSSPH